MSDRPTSAVALYSIIAAVLWCSVAVASDGDPVPADLAIVARAARVTSIVGAAGRSQHRIEYAVPLPHVAKLLIDLPESAQFRHALLDDRPAEVRRAGRRLSIELPRAADQACECRCTLIYGTEHALLEESGILQESLPAVSAVDELGREAPLEVLEHNWSVQVPAGPTLFENRGLFKSIRPLDAPSWLGMILRAVSAPRGVIWAAVLLAAIVLLLRTERRLPRAAAGLTLVLGTAGLLAAAGESHSIAQSSPETTLYHFRYRGSGTGPEALNVRYATATSAMSARCAAAASAAFLLWLWRRRRSTQRTLLGAAGLALPIAVLPLVATQWHFWLDGVVLGTVAAMILWAVRRIAAVPPRPHALATAAVLGTAVLLTFATQGSAEGPLPPPPTDETAVAPTDDAGAPPAETPDVVSLHRAVIEPEELRILSVFQVTPSSGSAAEFSAFLPEGYTISHVEAAGLTCWSVEDGIVTVTWNQPPRADIEILLDAIAPLAGDAGRAELAVPVPLDFERMRTVLAVWVDDALESTVRGDDLADWVMVEHKQLPDELRRSESGPPLLLVANDSPEPLPVGIGLTPRTSTVYVESLTTLTVTNAKVDYMIQVQGTVRGAGLRELTFTTPDWLAGRLEFTGRAVRSTAQEAMPDGLVRWTIRFAQPQHERFTLTAEAKLARPDDDRLLAPVIAFPERNVPDRVECFTQGSCLLFVNESDERWQTTRSLPTVSASALPFSITPDVIERAEACLRLDDAPEDEIAWTMVPHGEKIVPDALVRRANLRVDLQQDGTWRMEASYDVSHRSSRLLPVVIPEGVRLLAAAVNGEPARPMQTGYAGTSYLVPLPAVDSDDTVSKVALLLGSTIRGGLDAERLPIGGKPVELLAPDIPTPRADPEHGLPVLRTAWSISVPQALRAEIGGETWTSAAGFLVAFRPSAGPITVHRHSYEPSIRLRVIRAASLGPVAALVSAAIGLCAWFLIRRDRAARKTGAAPQVADRDQAGISALPYQSGIFLAKIR